MLSTVALMSILSCTPTGDGAAIESLDLTLTGSKVTAALTVSGPGDFLETFHYRVTKTGNVYAGPGFKLTMNGTDGRFTAVGPKHATLYAGEKLTSDVTCQH